MGLDPTSEKLCINNRQRSRDINDVPCEFHCAPYAAFLLHLILLFTPQRVPRVSEE